MGRMNGHYGDSSHANRREHYVRGHYSHARNRDSRGRYSHNGGNLIEHVERMMDEAETPEERAVIKRFKKELERV